MIKQRPRKVTPRKKRVMARGNGTRTKKSRRSMPRAIGEESANVDLLLSYPAHGLVTCELIIERMEAGRSGWDRRWDNARRAIADWVNACRNTDLDSFKHAEFDVWLGQEIGREISSTMQVTLASRGCLPSWPLIELLRQRPEAAVARWDWGKQPIELEAFPELHVAGGTVAHTWRLSVAFLALASERFKRRHKLTPDVDDPYQQLAEGAPEPAQFEWNVLRPSAEEERPKNVYIFEVVKGSPFDNGIKISRPEDAVSVGDVYDLADQIAWANVDITELDVEPYQRLHHVRYVRPALRAYCERFGVAVPEWLAEDTQYNALTEGERSKLFGMSGFGIRKFTPARVRKGMVVRLGTDDDA